MARGGGVSDRLCEARDWRIWVWRVCRTSDQLLCRNAAGLCFAMLSSCRAMPRGRRFPCSQPRTALTLAPNRLAKTSWLTPHLRRMLRISAGVSFFGRLNRSTRNTLAPLRYSTASRTLSYNSANSASFIASPNYPATTSSAHACFTSFGGCIPHAPGQTAHIRASGFATYRHHKIGVASLVILRG